MGKRVFATAERGIQRHLSPPFQRKVLNVRDGDGMVLLIYALVDAYPTPRLCVRRANRLANARKDLLGATTPFSLTHFSRRTCYHARTRPARVA